MTETFVINVLNTYTFVWLSVGSAFFVASLGVRLCIRAGLGRD